MNDLKVFENSEFGKVNVFVIEGEPWFIGPEIASVLGYTDKTQAIKKRVDSEDKIYLSKQELESLRGVDQTGLKVNNNGVQIINESGLYSLILSSQLDSAKKFKKWVTSEVLPSIRKTGSYTLKHVEDQPSYQIEDSIERAEAWIKEEKERRALRIENKELQSKNTELTAENELLMTENEMLECMNILKTNRLKSYKSIIAQLKAVQDGKYQEKDDENYQTIEFRNHLTKWRYKYYPNALKYLSEVLGHEIHKSDVNRLTNQNMYSVVIYELYEAYTDKYWESDLKGEDDEFMIKDTALGKFIIRMLKDNNEVSKYKN